MLSDDDRRARYDRYGHEGVAGQGFHTERFMDMGFLDDLLGSLFGGGFGASTGPEAGADAQSAVEIELSEALTGAHFDLDMELVSTCEVCEGDGAAPGSAVHTCDECDGAGQVRQVVRSPLGQLVRTMPCRKCGGRGRIPEKPCPDCRGRGRRPQRRKLGVDIPAGIDDGQALRLTGLGHAGELGAPAGDLYVRVHVKPDERFERDGLDLVGHLDLRLSRGRARRDAARSRRSTARSRSRSTPVSSPARVIVLKGHGMPRLRGGSRGDLRLIANVQVPRALDDEQRKVVESFRELEDERNYAHPERSRAGLRERLRRAFG